MSREGDKREHRTCLGLERFHPQTGTLVALVSYPQFVESYATKAKTGVLTEVEWPLQSYACGAGQMEFEGHPSAFSAMAGIFTLLPNLIVKLASFVNCSLHGAGLRIVNELMGCGLVM